MITYLSKMKNALMCRGKNNKACNKYCLFGLYESQTRSSTSIWEVQSKVLKCLL